MTTPELFKQWWLPKSMGITLESCEMDVRTGGGYRLVFGGGIPFFGWYLEVTPPSRLVWTNEEGDNGAVTTVTFTERGGKTLLVLHELYPSKDAFEAEHGMEDAMSETFEQLDELLVTLGEKLGRSRSRLGSEFPTATRDAIRWTRLTVAWSFTVLASWTRQLRGRLCFVEIRLVAFLAQ